MAYPPQPPPEDPWGPQAQGAPQEHVRPGYGQPGHGPQPRQGGPPDGFGRQQGRHGALGSPGPQGPHNPYDPPSVYGDPQSLYGGAQSPYVLQNQYGSQHQYGHGDPYGRLQDQYDYGLPPKRNSTLIIGLSIGLGLLLLAGGTVGAVSYLNASGSKPSVALPSTAVPTTAPWQSDSPSKEPSDEPTEPAAEPTGSPATSTKAQPGSPIAHTEFDDWKFDLTGIKFDANKVEGWTYDTCDPVDGEGVLARNKCERAVQIAYSAYRGHLKAVQVIMAFPSDKAAKATANRLAKLTSNAVNIRRDMTHTTYAYGRIRTNVAKKYVVATIVTADNTAKSKADKFHLYLQADSVGYFLLRDVTVTS
ncbi:hypothetical protein [Nonomuraea turcica]|uniref:hypothetical protein n=1 Tax=Nonomuraea sp. G32 TaxID=3067274 RepID=UPI00273C2B5B|nr:hypothetical protein [Nonomuraea sp. G32]MDP4501674.1 hypothetical protein [Nonomuraea sp. G32]